MPNKGSLKDQTHNSYIAIDLKGVHFPFLLLGSVLSTQEK